MTYSMQWHNQPDVWSESGDLLRVTTDAGTDFWRHTHYGFVRDSGHFRYREVAGDFSAEVSVKGLYTTLYDQAGLMIRLDAERWIKAGVEFTDGLKQFCVVVTNPRSDWSLVPLPNAPDELTLHVTLARIGETARIHYRVGGGDTRLARITSFPSSGVAQIGMMCCSPERGGFNAEFQNFTIDPAVAS